MAPRSRQRRTRLLCRIVAPTWLLMSSPRTGRPAFSNFVGHSFVESLPMNSGMQLTKAHPASMAHWA